MARWSATHCGWRRAPQAFEFAAISDAHTRAHAEHIAGLTDDAAVAEWAGIKVHVIEGAAENIKITTVVEDFQVVSKPMQAPYYGDWLRAMMCMRLCRAIMSGWAG